MTREQAIQVQIDECLDAFNAEECAKVCEFLWKRGGRHFPGEWNDEETFFPSSLRKTAREALREVAHASCEVTWAARSYILATKIEGVDENEYGDASPFIRLGLHFDITMADTQDGTAYEAQPPQTKD